MDREGLIRSAGELAVPPVEAVAEFEAKHPAIAEELNRRMLARPDLVRLVGPDNSEMMENNSRNFLRFMSSLFHHYDPAVFVETVYWVFRTYREHGFHISYWPANIDTCIEIMRRDLTGPTFDAVYPYFDWLLVNVPAFTVHSDDEVGGATGGR